MPEISVQPSAAPIPLVINGPGWVERFALAGDTPADVVWSMEDQAIEAEKLSKADGATMRSSRTIVLPFFETVLMPGEYPRFREMITQRRLQLPDLMKIMQIAMEAITERPTTPAPASFDGRGTTLATSAATSPSLELPDPASATSP